MEKFYRYSSKISSKISIFNTFETNGVMQMAHTVSVKHHTIWLSTFAANEKYMDSRRWKPFYFRLMSFRKPHLPELRKQHLGFMRKIAIKKRIYFALHELRQSQFSQYNLTFLRFSFNIKKIKNEGKRNDSPISVRIIIFLQISISVKLWKTEYNPLKWMMISDESTLMQPSCMRPM